MTTGGRAQINTIKGLRSMSAVWGSLMGCLDILTKGYLVFVVVKGPPGHDSVWAKISRHPMLGREEIQLCAA